MKKLATLKPFSLLFFIALATHSTFIAGCATSRKAGWDEAATATPESKAAAAKVLTQGMDSWKKRHQLEDLKKALELFEEAARLDPTNYEALTLLCRGNYLLADGHLEDPEERKRIWDIGANWGERAMAAANPEFRKMMAEEQKSIEEALPALKKEQVAALYWTAVNLGKWARLSGLPTMLKYKNRIKSMVERVEALDPKFFHGAVPRYWGTYYAVAPGFAGGDVKKSGQYFEESLKQAKNYFGTHVLLAENYAPKKSDPELFQKHLDYVLKTDPNSLPEVMPENVLEQRKAKKLLEKKDELF